VSYLRLLAAVLGAVIIAIGFVGLAVPPLLLEFGQSLATPMALYAVAAVRIAFGALLWCVATASRMPITLRVIGTVIVLSGLLTPFIGVERMQAMLTAWSGLGPILMRAAPGLAVLFGFFIIYAVSPRRRVAA
jgi:hypothetical protein